MSNIIENVSFAPAIIEVSGKTKSERQLSVARNASNIAQIAMVKAGGKLGREVRDGISRGALDGLAKACSNANYRPIAEYIAAMLGEPMVVTNRAAFESLPDQLEARIMKVKMSKSGGYTTDKKTGMQKPNATLAMLLTLKAECVEVIARVAQLVAERQAQRAAVAIEG
jgi:hypothetical protein